MKQTKYKKILNQRTKQREVEAELSEILRPFGLAINEWVLLCLVNNYEPVTATELRQDLDTSLAYITITLDKLERKKLVYRAPNMTDSRFKRVYFSGGNILQRIEKALEA